MGLEVSSVEESGGQGWTGLQDSKSSSLLNCLFLFGGQLLYNIVFVSPIYQHESVIGICISLSHEYKHMERC